MSREKQLARKLVLVPFPFQGHITPMLQLATVLHSKGFSITITHTSFNFPNLRLIHPHFNFLQFSNGQPFDPSIQDFPSFLSNLNIDLKVPLEDCLSKIMKDKCHDPCIIYDGNMHFAEEVAHCLNLPSIVLRTSSAASSLAYQEFPRLRNEGYIPLQDEDSDSSAKPVPGLHPLRFKDLPFGNSKKLFIVDRIVDVNRNTRSSSAIIWNSVLCLENSSLTQLQQKCKIPIFPIGPLHRICESHSSSILEEDTGCMAWLDKQVENSVIYVSMGSIVSMDEKEVIEMAWGLANSKQPFLWVGLEIENELERADIERAVKRLMAEDEGNKMRRRATELKEEIKHCVQRNGSSQSSLNDLVEFIVSV
ncbi:hypothetical protein ACFE04_013935 [Oxalis oulophora]